MPFEAWRSWREHARLHRGLLLSAPVFWGAFTVFVSPAYGAGGFLLHFLLCLPRGRTAVAALLLAYPLLCAWFAHGHPTLTNRGAPFHREPAFRGGPRFLAGEVASPPIPMADRGHAFLLVTEEGLYRASMSAGKIPPALGAGVLLAGREEAPEPPSNPGGADPRAMLRAQGAVALFKGEDWILLRPPARWKSALADLRSRLGGMLADRIPGPGRALVSAALLNDSRGVSPSTREAFRRSGMQHLLALSGLHLGLFVSFLLLPALCLRVPRKAAFLAAGALTVVYLPVTGAPVSLVRAGLMLACFLPSVLLERPSSALNTLFLAAALDLLASPFHVLHLGFQLSYAATLALILCAQPSRDLIRRVKSRRLGACLQTAFLSLMVAIFTYAPLAASIHAMSPWSILGNLLAVPVAAAMLISGLCVWSFGLLSLPVFLQDWAGACAGLCALALEGCAHFLARLPSALWPIAHPPAPWLILLSAGALATAALFKLGRWRLGWLGAAALVAAEILRPALSGPFPGGARVTLLSVGHGDAAVLELPGATFLIDAGESPRVATRDILPFLQSRGIRRLDAVLLTHPDRDHYGGASGLLGRIPIGFMAGPPVRDGGTGWNCLKAEARGLEIPWREIREGDLLYRGGNASLLALGPGAALATASDNDQSVVCLLRTRAGNILFTGDIEGPAQRALAESWPLWRGSWLKVPHHGSDRTNLPCFLEAVRAPQAAISSGRRPGFPGPTTLAALSLAGSETAVTARDGAVSWDFPARRNAAARCRKFRSKL